MKAFIEKLRNDEAFAKKFQTHLASADSKVAQGTAKVGEELNKVVMDTIMEFAKDEGITLKDDKDVQKQLSIMSKQIGLQLNEMIIKQMKAMKIGGEKM